VESRGDAECVRSLCEKLNVPCSVVSIKPGKIAAVAKKRGIGIEAAARLYRRRAWFREAEAYQQVKILVAHTADDMLETTLMRILRGSGPSGLAAMPVCSGLILRPLITLSRRDVLDYLGEKNISWREDSTNTDTQFLRNRVRHCLIPRLNEHFPQWRGAVSAMAKTQSLTAKFIKDEAACRIKWGGGNAALGSGTMYSLSTDVENFFAQPAIIREEALFLGINRLGLSAKIKRKNIRHFAERKVTAVDLGPLQIRKDAQRVTISATIHEGDSDLCSPRRHCRPPIPFHSEKGFSLLINALGSFNLKGIVLEVNALSLEGGCCGEGAFLALLPLVLRPRLKDDRIGGSLAVPAVFTAVDSLGPAAFIGSGNCQGSYRCQLLQRRDDAEALQAALPAALVQVTIKT
jgi:tRNA(Ile)-lysidine synthase